MKKAAVKYPYPVTSVMLKDGIEIAYSDVGKGTETLIFIHGLANYLPVWKRNIDALQHHYRCIAIDLPGNGLSSRGQYTYTMEFFTQTVLQFIDALGLKQVTLVGHSMGGQVSVFAALASPQKIKNLVLCAPAGFEVFTQTEKTIFKGLFKVGDLFMSESTYLRNIIQQSFYDFPKTAEEIITQLIEIVSKEQIKEYRRMIEACIDSMLSQPVLNKLKQVQCPTLVIYGENDRLIPNVLFHPTTTTTIAQKGISQINKGQLEMIPRCGHFVHYEKAEEVNAKIEAFIG